MARGRLRSTVSSAGSAPCSRRCHFFTIELPPGDVGTLFVVGKLSSQPVTHYRIVAVVALLLSLGAPLAAGAGFMPCASADAVTVMTLMVMHVIGAAITVPLFTTLAIEK